MRKKALNEAPADAQATFEEIEEEKDHQPKKQKRTSPQVVTLDVLGTAVEISTQTSQLLQQARSVREQERQRVAWGLLQDEKDCCLPSVWECGGCGTLLLLAGPAGKRGWRKGVLARTTR